MALPNAAALQTVTDIPQLKTLVHIEDTVWQAFINQVGEPAHVGHLASLPSWIVAQACSNAIFADSTHFAPIHATQVGLLWQAARKKIYLSNGGAEENFVDIEPGHQGRGQLR